MFKKLLFMLLLALMLVSAFGPAMAAGSSENCPTVGASIQIRAPFRRYSEPSFSSMITAAKTSQTVLIVRSQVNIKEAHSYVLVQSGDTSYWVRCALFHNGGNQTSTPSNTTSGTQNVSNSQNQPASGACNLLTADGGDAGNGGSEGRWTFATGVVFTNSQGGWLIVVDKNPDGSNDFTSARLVSQTFTSGANGAQVWAYTPTCSSSALTANLSYVKK